MQMPAQLEMGEVTRRIAPRLVHCSVCADIHHSMRATSEGVFAAGARRPTTQPDSPVKLRSLLAFVRSGDRDFQVLEKQVRSFETRRYPDLRRPQAKSRRPVQPLLETAEGVRESKRKWRREVN